MDKPASTRFIEWFVLKKEGRASQAKSNLDQHFDREIQQRNEKWTQQNVLRTRSRVIYGCRGTRHSQRVQAVASAHR